MGRAAVGRDTLGSGVLRAGPLESGALDSDMLESDTAGRSRTATAGSAIAAVLTDEPYDPPPTTPARHAEEIPPDRVDLATALALAGVRTGATVLDLTAGGWFIPAAGAAAGPGGRVLTAQSLADIQELALVTHAFLPVETAQDMLGPLRPRLLPGARVIVEGQLSGRHRTLVARHGEVTAGRPQDGPYIAALCGELVAAAIAAGYATVHLEVHHGRLVAVLKTSTPEL